MNKKQQGFALSLELLAVIVILAILVVINANIQQDIQSAKIRATFIDMLNIAKNGKQITITKQSPFNTNYTIIDNYFTTTIPVNNVNTSMQIQTQTVDGGTKLTTYFQEPIKNTSIYFYKKRLYSE